MKSITIPLEDWELRYIEEMAQKWNVHPSLVVRTYLWFGMRKFGKNAVCRDIAKLKNNARVRIGVKLILKP